MKLWRQFGRKGLFTIRYDAAAQDMVQEPTAKGRKVVHLTAHVSQRTSRAVFHKTAALLRRADTGVQFAHDYIPIPSSSPAALQTQARKQSLAGRVLSNDEHKAAAELRAATRARKQHSASSALRNEYR